jgi:hypothetical protein
MVFDALVHVCVWINQDLPHSSVFEHLFDALGHGAHFSDLHRLASAVVREGGAAERVKAVEGQGL